MNIKTLLDEAMERGEKIKAEVVSEILKSKTLHELVSNQGFITAVSRIIETKDEVKRVIGRQVKSVFHLMDVPTKEDVKRLGVQLTKLEKAVDDIGRKRMQVKTLASHRNGGGKKRSAKRR